MALAVGVTHFEGRDKWTVYNLPKISLNLDTAYDRFSEPESE